MSAPRRSNGGKDAARRGVVNDDVIRGVFRTWLQGKVAIPLLIRHVCNGHGRQEDLVQAAVTGADPNREGMLAGSGYVYPSSRPTGEVAGVGPRIGCAKSAGGGTGHLRAAIEAHMNRAAIF